MENKLTTLKSEFNGIIAIKTNVQNVFDNNVTLNFIVNPNIIDVHQGQSNGKSVACGFDTGFDTV